MGYNLNLFQDKAPAEKNEEGERGLKTRTESRETQYMMQEVDIYLQIM